MESIFSVFNSKSSFTCSVEWWRQATHVGWSVELNVNSDTTKDTDWISSMVEPVTIDMDFSTTISWTSKWSSLSNSWWVEEDEIQTFSHILVVQGQLNLNIIEWWLEVVCWTLASSFSGGNNSSWGLSKSSEDTESIIGIINVINEVKWIEVVTLKSDQLASTKRTKIWNQLLECWIIVVPIFNVLFRVLLSVQRNGEWHCFSNNI